MTGRSIADQWLVGKLPALLWSPITALVPAVGRNYSWVD